VTYRHHDCAQRGCRYDLWQAHQRAHQAHRARVRQALHNRRIRVR